VDIYHFGLPIVNNGVHTVDSKDETKLCSQTAEEAARGLKRPSATDTVTAVPYLDAGLPHYLVPGTIVQYQYLYCDTGVRATMHTCTKPYYFTGVPEACGLETWSILGREPRHSLCHDDYK
jgi:hypothetical protein